MTNKDQSVLSGLEQIFKLASLDLIAKYIVEGTLTGLHKSPYHGFSVEFAEHRQYNTGESVRNIDWKVFAKTEKLFIKKYEEETNLRCHVVLDISQSMRYPADNSRGTITKLEYGVFLSAALFYLLHKQRDAIALSLFDESLLYHSSVKSSGSHLHTLLQRLESLRRESRVPVRTSAVKIIHEIAEKIHRRSFVVIISDMFDQLHEMSAVFGALKHLRHNGHEVMIFHTLEKRFEEEFDFPVGPAVFEDMETGEKLKVQTSQVRETYTGQIRRFRDTLRRKCGEFRIEYIPVDLQTSFDKVLLKFLIKRNQMSG